MQTILVVDDDDMNLKMAEFILKKDMKDVMVVLANSGLKAIDALPASVQRIGRIKALRIEALLGVGDAEEAEKLLNRKIVLTDVREGEVSLTNMWFMMCAMKKAKAEGIEVTEDLVKEMYNTLTPPAHLDFRMH